MLKIIIGILLSFIIGFICQKFEISLPAPISLVGVGLICALTCGYLIAARYF